MPRLPGSESGACLVGAHSPRSLPFAPPTRGGSLRVVRRLHSNGGEALPCQGDAMRCPAKATFSRRRAGWPPQVHFDVAAASAPRWRRQDPFRRRLLLRVRRRSVRIVFDEEHSSRWRRETVPHRAGDIVSTPCVSPAGGPSVRWWATLAQLSRRHCDPRHRRRPNQTFCDGRHRAARWYSLRVGCSQFLPPA